MVEFIYFDIGNVLLFFDHQRACRQIAELVGCSSDDVRGRLFAADHLARYERGEISTSDYYRPLTDRLHAEAASPVRAEIVNAGSDIFRLNTELIPVVAQLQMGAYRLGVLSNTCASHWQFISRGRYAVLADFFPVQVLSFQQRCLKPQATIYRRAVEMSGVDAAERVFFVDDKPENVAGARAAGMDAVGYRGVHHLVQELRRRGIRFNY